MPRKTKWEFPDGTTVCIADVRRWMASVGHRTPDRQFWHYVKHWDVPGKIAEHKRRGIFEMTITVAASNAGVKVRKARTPGTLARIAQAWPEAANDKGAHMGRPWLHVVR